MHDICTLNQSHCFFTPQPYRRIGGRMAGGGWRAPVRGPFAAAGGFAICPHCNFANISLINFYGICT